MGEARICLEHTLDERALQQRTRGERIGQNTDMCKFGVA